MTTAEFDDAALQRAIRNAEEIARLSPENPEAMASLAPQNLRASVGVLRRRGERVTGVAGVVRARPAIELSKKRDVVSAGFVETQAAIQAIANSKGLFAYDRFTAADYNLTARTPDGTGSGWASRSFNELRQLILRRSRPPRSTRRRNRRARSPSSPENTRSFWSRRR